MFEGKKIGRVKNLEKLVEEIHLQEKIVNDLKGRIQFHHNEVIGYNQQLKEQAIKQSQEDINKLTNLVFSLQNKIENVHALQYSSQNRLEEHQLTLEETMASIEGTRKEWLELVTQLNELRDKLKGAEDEYKIVEYEYNHGQYRALDG